MKRLLVLAITAIMMFAVLPAALADEGGKPAAHELEGKEWGEAVSELAKSEPGAVAAHIKEQKAKDKDEELDESDEDGPKGKAYGWHIKNEFGMSYGQLMKAYRAAFDEEGYVGPHGEIEPLPQVGAKAFWLAHMPV